MLWNQKPALMVGDESLCTILSRSIIENGAHVYYYTPTSRVVNLTHSRMQVISRDLAKITGSGNFIRRTSLIFYMLSNEYLEENYNATVELMSKIVESPSNRGAKIIVTVPIEECKVDLSEIIEVLFKTKHIAGSIVALPSIYGPEIKRGIIFNTLRQLKENPYKIRVEASPHSLDELIYAEDLTNALTKLLNKIKEMGIYRLIGSKARISDIIKRILTILGLDGITEIEYTGKIMRKNRKLIELSKPLEWFKPSTGINNGIKRTVDWFEAEYGPIQVCPRR